MKHRFVGGRKTKYGQDRILLMTANDEPMTFMEFLNIANFFFKNEDSIYPQSEGFRGHYMLLDAITDVAKGISVKDVCKQYKIGVENDIDINLGRTP